MLTDILIGSGNISEIIAVGDCSAIATHNATQHRAISGVSIDIAFVDTTNHSCGTRSHNAANHLVSLCFHAGHFALVGAVVNKQHWAIFGIRTPNDATTIVRPLHFTFVRAVFNRGIVGLTCDAAYTVFSACHLKLIQAPCNRSVTEPTDNTTCITTTCHRKHSHIAIILNFTIGHHTRHATIHFIDLTHNASSTI